MIETKNNSYKKWYKLIETKLKYANAPFSEHEVIYFRKSVGASGIKDQGLRADLKRHFYASMPEDGYNITLEHQQKGIDYLMANTFKKNGTLRKNNMFGSFELEVLKNYSHFKFVGLHRAGMSDYVLPLYECIAHNGDSFTYIGTVYSCIEVTDIHSKQLRAV